MAVEFGALTARKFDFEKSSYVGTDDFGMKSLLRNPIKLSQKQDLLPGEVKRDENGQLKEMLG